MKRKSKLLLVVVNRLTVRVAANPFIIDKKYTNEKKKNETLCANATCQSETYHKTKIFKVYLFMWR